MKIMLIFSCVCYNANELLTHYSPFAQPCQVAELMAKCPLFQILGNSSMKSKL